MFKFTNFANKMILITELRTQLTKCKYNHYLNPLTIKSAVPFIVVPFFSILEGYHKILQEMNGRSQRRTPIQHLCSLNQPRLLTYMTMDI